MTTTIVLGVDISLLNVVKRVLDMVTPIKKVISNSHSLIITDNQGS